MAKRFEASSPCQVPMSAGKAMHNDVAPPKLI